MSSLIVTAHGKERRSDIGAISETDHWSLKVIKTLLKNRINYGIVKNTANEFVR